MKWHPLFKIVLGVGIAGTLVSFAAEVDPASPGATVPAETGRLKVRLSWGHRSGTPDPFHLRFLTNEVALTQLQVVKFEPGDTLRRGLCETRAGAGDVDGVEFILAFQEREVKEIGNLQKIWAHLLANADADTARRLRSDPGYRRDTRKFTLQMDAEGTRGFSLTVDQLLTSKALWVPELDVFISAGDEPVSFEEHQQTLAPWNGRRVLAQLERDPEASYEQYTSRWEDLGSPAYRNPDWVPPGHIVGVTWDSAIPKFGIDRGAGVWNDYGNPDHFRFGYDFGELSPDLAGSWKGQKLANGLPILTTTVERDGVRYEVEQFAFPLHGPPQERNGKIAMVLLQKLRLTELLGQGRTLSAGMTHRREFPAPEAGIQVRTNDTTMLWEEASSGKVLLAAEGAGFTLRSNLVNGGKWRTNRIVFDAALPPHGVRELIVKLPSPLVPQAERGSLLALNYAESRDATAKFWSDYLAKGARFTVPEPAVNELFRANLWHALRLPRRHGGADPNVKIDLPYSNFAYDQHGTPWPVNQAIYVDYMLYDLRGYHDISAEELAAIYRNNQEPGGHVGGFANWGVYTPSMVYSVAKHYLLSRDRASLENLLPQTLRALDWCLAEMRKASERGGPDRGLVLAPLNDLSHDLKAWAFNQAYLYAGPELLGRVLTDIQHPRAPECHAAAQAMYEAVQRAFAHASLRSPLVQLRDHTWIPYVPADALTSRRLLEVWYPTDVDCGALHMSRLKALDPRGPLTSYLLNDHEDNLFISQWGMANEPVYNQHATAYLLRDDVKPAIRAFYSMMACAFSHSTFEPVEHRWSWGQYFGPPSTDGAWFELYRQMLIHERDDDSLLLLQATPRKWLEHGKQIRVERAPTYYGPLTMTVISRAEVGEILATLDLAGPKVPAELFLRLRHPQGKRIQTVSLNGTSWTDFDAGREWIRVPKPDGKHFEIVARF
jgi:hypothetical protein